MIFFWRSSNSLNGVDIEMSNFSATAASIASYQAFESRPGRDHGEIAPFSRLSAESETMSSGSNSIAMPSPVQAGQAPCGLLKENERGSISPTEMLQTGQA